MSLVWHLIAIPLPALIASIYRSRSNDDRIMMPIGSELTLLSYLISSLFYWAFVSLIWISLPIQKHLDGVEAAFLALFAIVVPSVYGSIRYRTKRGAR